MKYFERFVFTFVVFTFLCVACDNNISDNNITPGKNLPWNTIKSQADVAGVWEAETEIALLGDGETLPKSASIGIKTTLMNLSGNERVDIVMKFDFSAYLDEAIKLKPGSLSKDDLWKQVKAGMPGDTVNFGNYFMCESDYTFTSAFVGADDSFINREKNQIKMIMPKGDFGMMGLDVASDVTFIFDKIASRPAQITIKGGTDLGGGESVIAVKILNTKNDSEIERLGIGEYNEGFSNDDGDTLFSAEDLEYTDIDRGESRSYLIPPGKYVIKIKFYRGAFLGWISCKSESFTIESGGAGVLTGGYGDGAPGEATGLHLRITSLLNP